MKYLIFVLGIMLLINSVIQLIVYLGDMNDAGRMALSLIFMIVGMVGTVGGGMAIFMKANLSL